MSASAYGNCPRNGRHDDVVVIGGYHVYLVLDRARCGGLTGCEIAYDLYLKGKKPTIVEMKNDLIAVRGVCLSNSSYLRDFFALNKVPVFLESKVSEIDADSVTVMAKDGSTTKIKADSVIVSVGYVPAPIATKNKRVSVVGDALNVGNLCTVIWRAWDVAKKL